MDLLQGWLGHTGREAAGNGGIRGQEPGKECRVTQVEEVPRDIAAGHKKFASGDGSAEVLMAAMPRDLRRIPANGETDPAIALLESAACVM